MEMDPEGPMGTDATPTPIDPDARADLEAACRLLAEGNRITDPELLGRIRERADRVRREVFRRHGLLDVAVP